MFSTSLKMIKTDRNMSQLCQIVCKKYNFNISAFVGCELFLNVYAVFLSTVPHNINLRFNVMLPVLSSSSSTCT